MKIIGFVGIQDSNGMDPVWKHFGSAFEEQFPGATFCAERRSYDFWQIWKMWTYRNEIVAKYDTGEDVVFVGHSMGAMVAFAAASRFKKSKVWEVVTINAPHHFLFGIFTLINGCVPIKSPVLSTSGRYDEVIPWGTRYSKAATHIVLPINHHRDLMKNFLGIAEEIAKAARKVFEKARRE